MARLLSFFSSCLSAASVILTVLGLLAIRSPAVANEPLDSECYDGGTYCTFDSGCTVYGLSCHFCNSGYGKLCGCYNSPCTDVPEPTTGA